MLNFADYTAIDLTYPLSESSIFWPNGEGFNLCLDCTISSEGEFYAAGKFSCSEHCGTHVDAPLHFNQKGISVDLIPIQDLIAPLQLIDITLQCKNDPDYELQVEDILNYEMKYGILPEKCIVLIRTGWGMRYKEGSKSYLGFDSRLDGEYNVDTSRLSFPGIGMQSAHLLVDRGIAGVGLDTASLDHGPSKDFLTHRILLGAGIYGIENISDAIQNIPEDEQKAYIIVMPMKIQGGSGAPSRVVAMLPTI